PAVHRQRALGEQRRAAGVLRGANAGDLGRRAIQRVGDLAGHHVDLVAAGECDQDVGVGDAGRLQYVRIGAVAGDRADIQAVLQVAQRVLTDVDDRDLVGRLAREMISGGAAHLAGAEDQDLHARVRSLTLTPPFTLPLTPPADSHTAESTTWSLAARSSPARVRAAPVPRWSAP